MDESFNGNVAQVRNQLQSRIHGGAINLKSHGAKIYLNSLGASISIRSGNFSLPSLQV